MKKIVWFISVFIMVLSSTVQGQEKRKNLSVDAEFNWLLHYKRQYEEYRGVAKKRDSYIIKRDSVYKLYVNQIESIRRAPEVYLSHIDRAIDQKKVVYDGPARVLYSYVNTAMPFDSDLYYIYRLDLYKIIKKYLFEKRDSLLPEKTEAYIKAGGDNSGGYKLINK